MDLARICFGLYDGPDDGDLPGGEEAYATLIAQIRPLIISRARRVCRDSNRLDSCSHPHCDGWFCAATEEVLIVRLLGPSPGRAEPQLKRFVAANPDASDDDLVQHTRTTIRAVRWEDVQRQVAKNLGFPGRVDVFLAGSPHQGCLAGVLDEVIADHRALVERTGLPTELRVWCVALQADAYQPARRFPDTRRVLRRLARGSAQLRRLLDGTDDKHEVHLLGELEAVVAAVDQALGSLNDNHCLRCGGFPDATPKERLERAVELLEVVSTSKAEEDAERLAALEHFAMPPTEDTAAVILALLSGDPWEDSWFDRYVGGPRNCFFVADPSDQLEQESDDDDDAVLSDEKTDDSGSRTHGTQRGSSGRNPNDGR